MDSISLIQASFATYYGLDWLSMGFGFLGLYLLTERKRVGFLFSLVGFGAAIITAYIAGQYGFMVANTISILLAIRGLVRWYETTEDA